MTSPSTPAGLRPRSTVLDDGARVLAKQTRTTPAVTISLSLTGGSIYDPEGGAGTAYFLARVIDRGTGARTGEAIAEALDLRGVSLRASVTRHTLTLACDCLSEDFDDVLAILADIVRDPSCPDREIEPRRGEVLTAIRQDADSPATTALERLMSLLYGATHPYGRATKGTLASVGALGRRSLLDFHAQRLAPTGLSAVVVGDVDPEAATAAVARAFDGWRPEGTLEAPPLAAPAPADERRRDVVSMMDKAQADIAYGFTTISRDDPRFHAYSLMSNVFGQYGMGGRLGLSIRERQGMAYYAVCGFEAGVIPGPLIVRAGVNASNVDRALASIDAEVEALAAEGVTDDELANSKRYLVGSLPRTLETNAGIAAFLQNVQHFDLGLDYDQRLPGLIAAVTREAVHEAARATLRTDRAAVVIAGPYEDAGGG